MTSWNDEKYMDGVNIVKLNDEQYNNRMYECNRLKMYSTKLKIISVLQQIDPYTLKNMFKKIQEMLIVFADNENELNFYKGFFEKIQKYNRIDSYILDYEFDLNKKTNPFLVLEKFLSGDCDLSKDYDYMEIRWK